jgi:putative spermidine/putrescine transport system permease protein
MVMAKASADRAPWLLSGPGLALFAALLGAPLVMTFMLSFYQFDYATGGIQPGFSLANYLEVIEDDYFHLIFGRTFGIAFLVSIICVLIGAPEAYILNRISVIVRTLGWALLFGSQGGISTALQWLGLSDGPVSLMFTTTGMVIALVHVLVPFMVLTVWASLQRLDPQVEDAALTLGASQSTVLRRIVLPQVMPGVLSGSLIVFSLTASAFATPAIIGGRRLKVVATTAYDEYLSTLNWPLGAAIAILLLVATVIVIMSYNRLVERRFAKVFE